MKSLKLNILNKHELKQIQAGTRVNDQTFQESYDGESMVVCRCACAWAGQGGSSSDGNGNANAAGGLSSPGM